MRVRVPHGREDKRLRLHRLREQMKRYEQAALLYWRQSPRSCRIRKLELEILSSRRQLCPRSAVSGMCKVDTPYPRGHFSLFFCSRYHLAESKTFTSKNHSA